MCVSTHICNSNGLLGPTDFLRPGLCFFHMEDSIPKVLASLKIESRVAVGKSSWTKVAFECVPMFFFLLACFGNVAIIRQKIDKFLLVSCLRVNRLSLFLFFGSDVCQLCVARLNESFCHNFECLFQTSSSYSSNFAGGVNSSVFLSLERFDFESLHMGLEGRPILFDQ